MINPSIRRYCPLDRLHLILWINICQHTMNILSNRSLISVVSQILWCFYRLWGADISVLSQVVILSVYEKKNGTDEIWCSSSPGIPISLKESYLHGSQRKSYLSVPFFFHLRCEWLVRGRLYMPNLRYELHHKICNLRYETHGYLWVLPLVTRIDGFSLTQF